jgi:hypothetical protein
MRTYKCPSRLRLPCVQRQTRQQCLIYSTLNRSRVWSAAASPVAVVAVATHGTAGLNMFWVDSMSDMLLSLMRLPPPSQPLCRIIWSKFGRALCRQSWCPSSYHLDIAMGSIFTPCSWSESNERLVRCHYVLTTKDWHKSLLMLVRDLEYVRRMGRSVFSWIITCCLAVEAPGVNYLYMTFSLYPGLWSLCGIAKVTILMFWSNKRSTNWSC